MTFEELVKFYFDRLHATQELWGVYLTVLLGLVAFWGGINRTRKSIIAAVFVSAGFVSFAVANDLALEQAQEAQDKVQQIIVQYADTPGGRLAANEALRTVVDPPIRFATMECALVPRMRRCRRSDCCLVADAVSR